MPTVRQPYTEHAGSQQLTLNYKAAAMLGQQAGVLLVHLMLQLSWAVVQRQGGSIGQVR